MNQNTTIFIPQDIEAEQAVLGSIIYNNNILSETVSFLSSKSFFLSSHQYIFKAMLKLDDKENPIDEITLGDELKSMEKLNKVGGYAYLAELVDCVPSTSNIQQYLKIVQEHSLLRDLIETSSEIARKSQSPNSNITDLLAEAENKIKKLSLKTNQKNYSSIKNLLVNNFEKLEKLSETKSEITGIETGLIDLDRYTSGFQNSDLIVIGARPSMGKGLKMNEPVLMPDGSWKKNKNLKVGDPIASVDGGHNEVTGVFPKGEIDFYRVTFKDGRAVDCDLDHKWTISSSKWSHKRRTVDISELNELINERVRYRGRIYTEPISGNFGSEFNEEIDPWVLGALLGDGGITGTCIKFSNTEEYMLSKMRRLFSCEMKDTNPNDKSKCDFRFSNGRKTISEMVFIRKYGLHGKKSFDKFVPDVIFKSSKTTREKVLAGLIETDGWVEKKGSLFFGSSSIKLRDDVVSLVRSIGGSAKPSIKDKRYYTHKGEKLKGLDSYQCVIRLPDTSFLESPRILSRLKQRHMAFPVITNVDYIGKKESQCISVSHESKLYCVNNYIMTHNTTLALNIAANITTKKNVKGAVLIFSLEMSKDQLTTRILSSLSKVDGKKLKIGNLEQGDWNSLAMATNQLSSAKIYINDSVNITSQELTVITKQLDNEEGEGVSMVIVDYLQLMRGSRPDMPREQVISKISRSLKALAKDLNIPVIALSQLNRSLENRSDKHPQLSDLRESGAIEQDADIILFIYRDEVYNPETKDKGTAEIIIAKHRNGPTGMLRLAWFGNHTKFDNLSQTYQEEF